ncbi:MAG: hypothetical protein ACLQGU_02570 [bacterium]
MKNVTEAKKELAEKQAVLEKLVLRRAALTQEIEELQNERSTAVRELAEGRGKAKEKIAAIEARIAPLALQKEGVDGLIEEGEAKVNGAREGLKQAQADEAEALQSFINEREKQECTDLVNGIDTLVEEFIDQYIATCSKLSELSLLNVRAAAAGINHDRVQDALFRLWIKTSERLKQQNWKPLGTSGCPVDLIVQPLLRSPVSVVTADIARIRTEQRRQKWEAEFRNQKI